MSSTYLQTGFFLGGLLGEETSGEVLLHIGRDENAAEAVFGFGAKMDTNTTASRNLTEDGKQALELGAHRYLDAVDESRDEVVGILQSVTDVVFTFSREACTLVEIVRGVV